MIQLGLRFNSRIDELLSWINWNDFKKMAVSWLSVWAFEINKQRGRNEVIKCSRVETSWWLDRYTYVLSFNRWFKLTDRGNPRRCYSLAFQSPLERNFNIYCTKKKEKETLESRLNRCWCPIKSPPNAQ